MRQDLIVLEIRHIRDAHAKRFNDDLHAICEDFRKTQSVSGHKIVSRRPRGPIIHITQPGDSLDEKIGADDRLFGNN